MVFIAIVSECGTVPIMFVECMHKYTIILFIFLSPFLLTLLKFL